MDNMNFEQLRQMGMAPSRQIDMAPLNIPGVAQTPSVPTQGVGNIDTRISELENMFANVYTNRAFSQQEMQDMNQKRQLLDNLYRIRESSQSRAVADEERKQKIEALKQVGEKAKEDKRNAQLARAKEIPSTFVSERMGQNPYVPAGAGTFIDSQGRTAAVPKYGTVTPAMYGALGESRLKGTAAPTAQDFQPKETPYTITENRINEAIKLNDYGKASMLAQQQINNLAQIAAMPGLSEEAKQVLNANMISLANQAKNNAGIYQEQIKAKALVQKAALDNQNKMEIERLKSDPKFQKLDQQTQSTIMKIYSDNFHKEVEVPVWDSTKNKWATTLEGKSVTEKRRIIELSPQQVEYLTGRKISAKDYATENYKAQLQMLGIQPTEAPMPTPNVAPQGTQVNLSQAEKTTIAFEALKAIHQANIPTEKVLKDLSTEEGRKAYRQQFPGIDLNNLIVALDSSPDSNIQLQTMNKLLQSARLKGKTNGSVVVNKKSSNKTPIPTNVSSQASVVQPIPSAGQTVNSLPDNLLRLAMLAENAGMQGHPQTQLTNYMPTGDRQILVKNPVANNYVYPQDVIPGSDFVPVNTNTTNLPPGIIQLMALLNGKTETKKKAGVSVNKTNTTNNPVAQPIVSLPDNLLRLAMLAENAGMQGHPQTQLTNYRPQVEKPYQLSQKGANTLRSMMDSVTLNQVLTPAPEEPIMTPPITNERQVMKPTIQDVAEAINEAELINRKRIANGEPPLDSRIFDLINIWKRKINQELYPTPKGYPSPEVEALSKPQRYIDLNRNY